MSKYMYLFMPHDSNSVCAFTRDKDVAGDFYDINKERYRMVKLSKEEISEGIHINAGCAITYYVLTDGDGKKYSVPMTVSESSMVVDRCNEICMKCAYIYNELIEGNKFGLKSKYLKVIGELTKVLSNKEYLQYVRYTGILTKENLTINTLKIYDDLCLKSRKYELS